FHRDFLKRPMIHAVTVFEVKRDACGDSGWCDRNLELHGIRRVDVGHGGVLQTSAMFVVNVRDEVSGEEHSEGASEKELAIFTDFGLKCLLHHSRVLDSLDFPAPGGKPFGVEIAAFSRSQMAERRIDFSLHIKRSIAGLPGTKRWHSVCAHSQVCAVGPEDD